MRRIITVLSILFLILTFFSTADFAANSSIEGYVKDAKTREPLFGANVMIVGTGMGAATDMSGKYVFSNVLPGLYTIRATYIGYKTQNLKISVVENNSIKQNFSLEPVGVEGKTVVVTAQATGQSQAINQQLSSDQIINVVSAAKIQELPDANAAESVGRLPGISVLRNGGEGTEVVIRGLQPKYNQILIDGMQMASSNPYDRSTDLSMISSNMLEGIQVSKTVTPDMDANVIGGTVNFELREAKVIEPGVPKFGLLIQGGYNNLSDVYNRFNNYKYVGSAEDRFLNDRLGVFAQLDIERKNLSSNELGASYNHLGNSYTQYITTGLNLYDISRDIQRNNAALVIDYKLPDGKIKFSNFASTGSSYNPSRSESFDIGGNAHYYGLSSATGMSSTISNSIDYQQQLPIFQMDAKFSHSYSETKDPNDWSVNFLQQSAGIGQFSNISNVNPQDIPKASNNNLSTTYLNSINNSNYFSRERALTGSLDFKTNINFSDLISAEIKFGGMYRYQTRSFNYDLYDGGGLNFGGAGYVDNLIINYFSLPQTVKYNIPIHFFTDPNFSYGKFLNGNYTMSEPLNLAMLSQMVSYLRSNVQAILANNGSQAFGHDNFNSTTSNYYGHENQSAFYLMSVMNIGPQITFIPGVRYQDLQTTYTGIRGIESRNSFSVYNHYDTSAVQDHGYWLPDVSLRYKPLSWFDIRLSYTNTLAYPDYNAIIPRIDLGNGTIAWNNYKLVPSRSKNYDAYFSFYDNTIGLFTAGAFLKQIDNLIYPWTFYVSGANALQYLPYSLLGAYQPSGTYSVSTYVNDSYMINNYGMELDWQTHFWYLPGPLAGLVFSANYTHIFSKAQYPYVKIVSTGRSITYIDTSFTDRLLDQPDNIVNLSLGFDYLGFSVRVSMLYQADIFTGPNVWPQLKTHTSAYTRWDLAAKQELPWFGIQIYGDLNNINGANDISVIQGAGVPQSEQDYGMTADVGLRWSL
ncbi:MAG: TonB-dependent receptor [Ignavibacteriaceae bacterium]